MTATVHLLVTERLVLGTLADPDQSVAAGRKALDQWWWQSYPWYDSSTDGVGRIDVSEPWYMKWKFWEWLADWDWPDWLTSGLSFRWPQSFLQWLGWIAVAVVLIGLVYLIVRAFRMRQRRRPAAGDDSGRPEAAEDRRRVEALPLGAGRKPFDPLAEARQHYQQGNYREAIIYLFSYQLVQLDKHHLIRLTKGKTNRQYVRELGRRMTLRGLLEQTMVAFEEVFFGNYTIDRTRFESCWSRLAEFEALVTEGAV